MSVIYSPNVANKILSEGYVAPALAKACASLGKSLRVAWTGAPRTSLDDEVRRGIETADVFVSDMPYLRRMIRGADTPPNYLSPEVVLDLGYAIGLLGWSRIVFVVENDDVLPEQMAFWDPSAQVVAFESHATLDENSKANDALAALLRDAIERAQQTSPRRARRDGGRAARA